MNEQEQMMQIISAISEKTGEAPEKVVAMLQEIMQTEGQEGVKAFINKMLNTEAEMFRKGGKMEAAVNKFQRGGLLSRRQLRSRMTDGAGFTDEQFDNSYVTAKDAFRRQGLRGRNMRSAVQNAMLSIVPQPKANIDMDLVKNPEQALRLKAQSSDGMRQRTVYDNVEYTGTPAQQYDQMMSDKMTTRVPMAEVGTQEDPREASLREAPWRANWGMAHDAMFMGGSGEPIVFNHDQQQSQATSKSSQPAKKAVTGEEAVAAAAARMADNIPEKSWWQRYKEKRASEGKPLIGNYDSNGNWRLFVQDKEQGGKINKCQGGWQALVDNSQEAESKRAAIQAAQGTIESDDRSAARKAYDIVATAYRNSDFANSAPAKVLSMATPYGVIHYSMGDRDNGASAGSAILSVTPFAALKNFKYTDDIINSAKNSKYADDLVNAFKNTENIKPMEITEDLVRELAKDITVKKPWYKRLLK